MNRHRKILLLRLRGSVPASFRAIEIVWIEKGQARDYTCRHYVREFIPVF